MKLEVGKRYLTKKGEVVFITHKTDSTLCMRGYHDLPTGKLHGGWLEDGRASAISNECPDDIVSEWSMYPEHEKLKAIKGKSQAIGGFLDWLRDGGLSDDHGAVMLAYYPYITERPVYKGSFPDMEVVDYEPIPREEWERSSELHSLSYPLDSLLAQFFEIDLNKLEEEKRAMLEECRKVHEAKK